jgi:predicted TIM-barrel fold metal-dependent hydrolase
MSIDTHIHLFTRALPRSVEPRHNPDYDATLESLQAVSAESGVRQFVVVQPSFLGYDNTYLLEQIRMHPAVVAGVAVLDPETTEKEISELRGAGIRGIRLNLLDKDLGQELNERKLGLVRRCAEQGLHIEVHDSGSRLPFILDKIGPLASTVVIDHFGRPDPARGGVESREFEALLRAGEDRDWYVKISAPYRCPGIDVARAYRQFKQRWGMDKLLWGSDWPWTQHESLVDYASWCQPFDGEPALPALLERNAQGLYGCAPAG